MNKSPTAIVRTVLFLFAATWALLACGVKGDPLPPDQPPFIGRGHTNYKGAFVGENPVKGEAQDVKATPKNGNKNDEDSDKSDDEENED